jgi:hypothetical protein
MTQTSVKKNPTNLCWVGHSFSLQIDYLDDKFETLHAQDTKTAQLIFSSSTVLPFSLSANIGITGVTLLLVVKSN